MKLHFKKLIIKNFFSVGAIPLEYTFTSGINAIIGRNPTQDTTNGIGKSILNDAIIFALFGSSMRNLNIDQMINKLNGKECEITLFLDINDVPYKIERGLSPNYCRLINENEVDNKTTSKKETQQKINDLIKISKLSFINSITLNIGYSKPFFKLEASEKRTIFEDGLNLSVYGKMFKKVSKEYNEHKQNKKIVERDLESLNTLLNDKTETQNKLNKLQQEFENTKQNELTELSIKKQQLIDANVDYTTQLSNKNYNEIKDKLTFAKNDFQNKIYKIEANYNSLSNEIKKLNKEKEFYKLNPFCPTCKKPTNTDSDHNHLNTIEIEINSKIETFNNYKLSISNGNLKLTEIVDKLNKVDILIKKDLNISKKIEELNYNLREVDSKIESTKNKTLQLTNVVTDEEIQICKTKLTKKENEYSEYENLLNYSDYLRNILGEEGIRTYIVNKIVPLLNKNMNTYLSMFGANYNISFDKELKETLKSRNRDEFSYNNFSSGEEKRIDLAFMFSFLDITKMQNSINCNILILDEILDSSMCRTGIENLMSFLKTKLTTMYPELCVYIITHKSEIDNNHFDRIIKLKKENDFTKLEEIEEIQKTFS